MARRGCDRTLIRLFIISDLLRYPVGKVVPKTVAQISNLRSAKFFNKKIRLFLKMQILIGVLDHKLLKNKPSQPIKIIAKLLSGPKANSIIYI